MRYVVPEKVVKKHLKNNKMPKWRVAILCFHSLEKSKKIVKFFNGKLVGYRIFSKCNENYVFEANINGENIGILCWCTGGGPLVASIIEELSVIGVEYILGIGAAAAINHSVSKYDLIIPTIFQITDGTSKCYESNLNQIYMEDNIIKMIKKIEHEKNIFLKEVKAATIDALYRQTEESIMKLRNDKCDIVNWELTPFYLVSKACNIKSAWIGHISDVEINGVWDDWYCNRSKLLNEILVLAEAIVFEFLKSR